jgi:hypothetical protein
MVRTSWSLSDPAQTVAFEPPFEEGCACIREALLTLQPTAFCYPVIGSGFGDVANERGIALAQAMKDRCVLVIREWKAFEFLKP